MGAYEFGPDHTAVFQRLATTTRVMAWAGFALAAVFLSAGVLGLVRPPLHLSRGVAPTLAVLVLLGAPAAVYASVRLRSASARLALVATSVGRDVPHAVSAGASLADAFRAVTGMLFVHVCLAVALVALGFPRG